MHSEYLFTLTDTRCTVGMLLGLSDSIYNGQAGSFVFEHVIVPFTLAHKITVTLSHCHDAIM